MAVDVNVVAKKSCPKGVYVSVDWYDRLGLIDMTSYATKKTFPAATPTDLYVGTYAFVTKAKVSSISCN